MISSSSRVNSGLANVSYAISGGVENDVSFAKSVVNFIDDVVRGKFAMEHEHSKKGKSGKIKSRNEIRSWINMVFHNTGYHNSFFGENLQSVEGALSALIPILDAITQDRADCALNVNQVLRSMVESGVVKPVKKLQSDDELIKNVSKFINGDRKVVISEESFAKIRDEVGRYSNNIVQENLDILSLLHGLRQSKEQNFPGADKLLYALDAHLPSLNGVEPLILKSFVDQDFYLMKHLSDDNYMSSLVDIHKLSNLIKKGKNPFSYEPSVDDLVYVKGLLLNEIQKIKVGKRGGFFKGGSARDSGIDSSFDISPFAPRIRTRLFDADKKSFKEPNAVHEGSNIRSSLHASGLPEDADEYIQPLSYASRSVGKFHEVATEGAEVKKIKKKTSVINVVGANVGDVKINFPQNLPEVVNRDENTTLKEVPALYERQPSNAMPSTVLSGKSTDAGSSVGKSSSSDSNRTHEIMIELLEQIVNGSANSTGVLSTDAGSSVGKSSSSDSNRTHEIMIELLEELVNGAANSPGVLSTDAGSSVGKSSLSIPSAFVDNSLPKRGVKLKKRSSHGKNTVTDVLLEDKIDNVDNFEGAISTEPGHKKGPVAFFRGLLGHKKVSDRVQGSKKDNSANPPKGLPHSSSVGLSNLAYDDRLQYNDYVHDLSTINESVKDEAGRVSIKNFGTNEKTESELNVKKASTSKVKNAINKKFRGKKVGIVLENASSDINLGDNFDLKRGVEDLKAVVRVKEVAKPSIGLKKEGSDNVVVRRLERVAGKRLLNSAKLKPMKARVDDGVKEMLSTPLIDGMSLLESAKFVKSVVDKQSVDSLSKAALEKYGAKAIGKKFYSSAKRYEEARGEDLFADNFPIYRYYGGMREFSLQNAIGADFATQNKEAVIEAQNREDVIDWLASLMNIRDENGASDLSSDINISAKVDQALVEIKSQLRKIEIKAFALFTGVKSLKDDDLKVIIKDTVDVELAKADNDFLDDLKVYSLDGDLGGVQKKHNVLLWKNEKYATWLKNIDVESEKRQLGKFSDNLAYIRNSCKALQEKLNGIKNDSNHLKLLREVRDRVGKMPIVESGFGRALLRENEIFGRLNFIHELAGYYIDMLEMEDVLKNDLNANGIEVDDLKVLLDNVKDGLDGVVNELQQSKSPYVVDDIKRSENFARVVNGLHNDGKRLKTKEEKNMKDGFKRVVTNDEKFTRHNLKKWGGMEDRFVHDVKRMTKPSVRKKLLNFIGQKKVGHGEKLTALVPLGEFLQESDGSLYPSNPNLLQQVNKNNDQFGVAASYKKDFVNSSYKNYSNELRKKYNTSRQFDEARNRVGYPFVGRKDNGRGMS